MKILGNLVLGSFKTVLWQNFVDILFQMQPSCLVDLRVNQITVLVSLVAASCLSALVSAGARPGETHHKKLRMTPTLRSLSLSLSLTQSLMLTISQLSKVTQYSKFKMFKGNSCCNVACFRLAFQISPKFQIWSVLNEIQTSINYICSV